MPTPTTLLEAVDQVAAMVAVARDNGRVIPPEVDDVLAHLFRVRREYEAGWDAITNLFVDAFSAGPSSRWRLEEGPIDYAIRDLLGGDVRRFTDSEEALAVFDVLRAGEASARAIQREATARVTSASEIEEYLDQDDLAEAAS